jgi:PII-like signaling protein
VAVLRKISSSLLESVRKGNDVGLLLSDGIPIVVEVYNTFEELSNMITYISERFETNSNYSILLSLRYSYDFLNNHFSHEVA